MDGFAARQQSALLAARLIRLETINQASQILLWRLCDRVLAVAGYRLALLPEQVEELCRLALSDDPNAPDAVLEWIDNHAKRVRRKSGVHRPMRESGGPAQ